MKKVNSITAITLIELIVSMVLVCIVMLGIFSINTVLSNNNQDYGQRYFVRSSTQSTLNHIINNASSVIGSAGGNTAFLIGTAGLGPDAGNYNATSFCFHQDIPATPTGANTIDNQPSNSTPTNYTDDRWLCYTWYPSGDANYPYQIWYCAMQYQTGATPNGASNCNSTENAHITAGPVYLGTSFANPAVTFTYPPNQTSTIPLQFTITIQNCLNNAATGTETCNTSPGTSGDMVNNPEIQDSGNAFPQQVGP